MSRRESFRLEPLGLLSNGQYLSCSIKGSNTAVYQSASLPRVCDQVIVLGTDQALPTPTPDT